MMKSSRNYSGELTWDLDKHEVQELIWGVTFFASCFT